MQSDFLEFSYDPDYSKFSEFLKINNNLSKYIFSQVVFPLGLFLVVFLTKIWPVIYLDADSHFSGINSNLIKSKLFLSILLSIKLVSKNFWKFLVLDIKFIFRYFIILIIFFISLVYYFVLTKSEISDEIIGSIFILVFGVVSIWYVPLLYLSNLVLYQEITKDTHYQMHDDFEDNNKPKAKEIVDKSPIA